MAFHAFAEPVPLLSPEAAVRYFLRLEPLLGVDPHRFGPDQERQAFTLAAATEETLLDHVQELIARALASGRVSDAPDQVEALLDEAGVSPANPQYAEMVFRTNAADAYNQGAWEEYTSPDVGDEFPAWQYSNPDDGRSREKHAHLDGRYFPASRSFNDVRGTGIEDVANCRCSFLPVHRSRWEKLRAGGASFHGFSERAGRASRRVTSWDDRHVWYEDGRGPGRVRLRKFAERAGLYSFADWEAYQGPRGGKGWKNTRTGRLVYGATRPDQRKPRGGQAGPPAPARPNLPGKGPVAALREPPDPVAALAQRLDAHLSGKKALSQEEIPGQVALVAQRLRAWEVHDLAERLGVKAGPKDTKTAMLAGIEARLREKAGAPRTTPRVGVIATDDLHLDPQRFQYKLDVSGPHGVGDELKGVRAFNPDLAGVLLVWRDPANGKDYVINGHHRADLAKRLGHPEMLVRYIDARDAREARAKGALANIAEGRGTAVDAAKFLRDTGTSVDDLQKVGVSLRGAVARDAGALAGLDDTLFNDLTTGRLRQSRALAIAENLTNPADQRRLYQVIQKQEARGKRVADDVVAELAKEAQAAPRQKESAHDLFGSYEDDRSLFLEKAQLKAYLRGSLAQEASAFRTVSTDSRAELLKRGGNVIEAERNRAIADESQALKDYFDTLVNSKGPLSEAVEKATEDYAAAKGSAAKQKVQQQALEKVRGLMQAEIQKIGPTAGGSRDDTEGNR